MNLLYDLVANIATEELGHIELVAATGPSEVRGQVERLSARAFELAGELGVLLARIEREIRGLGEIGRVHVCRWGDGGEHLHWWFMARPARIPQLIGSFAAIWDDILPPAPEEVWRRDLAALADALG